MKPPSNGQGDVVRSQSTFSEATAGPNLLSVRPGDAWVERLPKKTKLDAIDRQILVALKSDARIRNAELARQTGLSEGAVRQRLSQLLASGDIRGFCTLIRPGLIERAPLVWATFSIVASDVSTRSRFEQGLRASVCVEHLDRMKKPGAYGLRCYHEDVVDLITTVASTAGVMVSDVFVQLVETPIGPLAPDERSPSQRAPPRSGTAHQTGYENRS